MVASGVPIINGNQHAVEIAKMALDLLGKKGIKLEIMAINMLSKVPIMKRSLLKINRRVL